MEDLKEKLPIIISVIRAFTEMRRFIATNGIVI